MKKNNSELILEIASIAKAHQAKKEVIETILSDLDKEEKASYKHIQGMATVNELMKEISDLEIQYTELRDKIKSK